MPRSRVNRKSKRSIKKSLRKTRKSMKKSRSRSRHMRKKYSGALGDIMDYFFIAVTSGLRWIPFASSILDSAEHVLFAKPKPGAGKEHYEHLASYLLQWGYVAATSPIRAIPFVGNAAVKGLEGMFFYKPAQK